MKLIKLEIFQLEMRMKTPFSTSFGTVQNKPLYFVKATDESGIVGWGEGVAFEAPSYTEETQKTSLHIIEEFLVPRLLHQPLKHPNEVNQLFAPIRRNQMAKASIEMAVWDIYAQIQKTSLAQVIGGTRSQIDVGISLGIEPTIEKQLEKVAYFVKQGYKRVKIKIKPGWDVEVVKAIRTAYPNLPLMVDANSAYTLNDMNHLKQLDPYNLLMIEQPLAHDDLIDHATLQQHIQTPICLDESICSYEDARKAIQIEACKVINLKIARVGGISESIKIHDLCVERGIDLWCGGMLEAGIGRAHCVAITSLPGFNLPGDTAASSKYWEKDIISPEVEVNEGLIDVPNLVGIGYKVEEETIKEQSLKYDKYD
jgi:o-succinylbenzoate synthase